MSTPSDELDSYALIVEDIMKAAEEAEPRALFAAVQAGVVALCDPVSVPRDVTIDVLRRMRNALTRGKPNGPVS